MEGEGGELTRVSARALLSKTTQKYLVDFQPLLQGHTTLVIFRDDARMLGKNGVREYELGYREATYLDAKT